MGRIFEVRKHAMFARWNRMAKQFARIGKDITIAVKNGGPDPATNPTLRRVIQNARAVNMPKDKIEAAIKRASGATRRTSRKSSTRATRRTASPCWSSARPTTRRAPSRACATCSPRTAATSRPPAASRSSSSAWACSGCNPEGIDQDDLELYLIDHGLEEMGESTGDKGEPQLVARCLFEDFGQMQKALEDRGITPLSAEHEYICLAPTELPEDAGDRSPGADRQARAGRGRPEGLPHARLSRRGSHRPGPVRPHAHRAARWSNTRMDAARDLFSYRKHWAHRFGPAPFLPMSRAEMDELGWDSCDVVLVTGDAYVDHPSFGMAIVGPCARGAGVSRRDHRAARLALGRTTSPQLGQPNLFFGITAGNMDSMVNRYTADRRIRSDDAYTPHGVGGSRPDRCVVVYAQRVREAYKDVPIVIGGIEASLRRIAHFDYWSEKVRRSVLLDAKADLLVYGNAERQICEIAHRLARGEPISADRRSARHGVRAAPPAGRLDRDRFDDGRRAGPCRAAARSVRVCRACAARPGRGRTGREAQASE